MDSSRKPLQQEQNKNPHEQPWLDEHGKFRSDQVLKVISVDWDAPTWERYLATVEFQQNESLVSERVYSKAIEYGFSIFELCNLEQNAMPRQKIIKLIETLPPTQKNVVGEIFLNGSNERDAAKRLGISRATLRSAKKRALKKIKMRHLRSKITRKVCRPRSHRCGAKILPLGNGRTP